jgi:hypothetical protein
VWASVYAACQQVARGGTRSAETVVAKAQEIASRRSRFLGTQLDRHALELLREPAMAGRLGGAADSREALAIQALFAV